MANTPTKTAVTALADGQPASAAIIGDPIGDLETNIDAILAYLAGVHDATGFTVEGVPVTERGENANGQWIRFADGTQICTFSSPLQTVIAEGNVSYTWTYPAVFAVAPVIQCDVHVETTDAAIASRLKGVTFNPFNTTEASLVAKNDGLLDRSIRFHPTAIGRWK